MNIYKISAVALICMSLALTAFSQDQKTEEIKVAGKCGMCKKKIEKAAREAGATYASWDSKSGMLSVRYNSQSTTSSKIQEKIAGAGYDTPEMKAADEAYNKLDACCKYERKDGNKEMNCCSPGCEMKNGKCADEAGCQEKGCCTDSGKCRDMGCCGDNMEGHGKMKSHDKMDGCQDGKSSKEGSSEKGCCKKSTPEKSGN